MGRQFSGMRNMLTSLSFALLLISLTGCPSKSSGEKKLDGVYHAPGGGPITLTIKDGKATMTVGNESKTMSYKVQGNKLTILNPTDGDAVYTINDDGTLNSEIGVFKRDKE